MKHAESTPRSVPVSDWEALWAPYDEATYLAALGYLEPGDVILDLGAGDLRFARRAAKLVRKVFAVERNGALLPRDGLPGNLTVVCADALAWTYPEGITAAVLLMRHCAHFPDYLARLRAAGCRRLVTNARWGMGVECLPLSRQAPYDLVPPGWYACACGAVGFKPAPPEAIHAGTLDPTHSVENCPGCRSPRMASGSIR